MTPDQSARLSDLYILLESYQERRDPLATELRALDAEGEKLRAAIYALAPKESWPREIKAAIATLGAGGAPVSKAMVMKQIGRNKVDTHAAIMSMISSGELFIVPGPRGAHYLTFPAATDESPETPTPSEDDFLAAIGTLSAGARAAPTLEVSQLLNWSGADFNATKDKLVKAKKITQTKVDGVWCLVRTGDSLE